MSEKKENGGYMMGVLKRNWRNSLSKVHYKERRRRGRGLVEVGRVHKLCGRNKKSAGEEVGVVMMWECKNEEKGLIVGSVRDEAAVGAQRKQWGWMGSRGIGANKVILFALSSILQKCGRQKGREGKKWMNQFFSSTVQYFIQSWSAFGKIFCSFQRSINLKTTVQLLDVNVHKVYKVDLHNFILSYKTYCTVIISNKDWILLLIHFWYGVIYKV